MFECVKFPATDLKTKVEAGVNVYFQLEKAG